MDPLRTRPRPWQQLDAEIATALHDGLGEVVDALRGAVPVDVPAFAEPAATDPKFARDIDRAVTAALDRFVSIVGRDEPALTPTEHTLYSDLGAGEARDGRGLESLLAAYRAGGRVIFRLVLGSLPGDARRRVDPADVATTSDAVFAFIDEISAASAEGYAAQVNAQATERDQQRRRLAALLLTPSSDRDEVRRLAAAAGWSLPARACVVRAAGDARRDLPTVLGDRALVVEEGVDLVAVVPTPARHRGMLRRTLAGRAVTVGPAVPLTELHRSAHLAQSLARLAPAGESAPGSGSAPSPPADPRFAEDHLLDLVLAADPVALADLSARRLAPFADESPGSRERLLHTLASWLRHWGARQAVAAELSVHPQTVGYRLARLRELLGDDLDDPQVRLELTLVLAGPSRLVPRTSGNGGTTSPRASGTGGATSPRASGTGRP